MSLEHTIVDEPRNWYKWWEESSAAMPSTKQASPSAVEFAYKISPKDVVLDLGGGTGADSMEFLKRGAIVVLFDISGPSLQKARARALREVPYAQLTTVQSDIRNLAPIGDSFDAVYAGQSIHFFDPRTTTRILKQINHTLRPEGIACLTAKSPLDEVEMDFLNSNSFKYGEGLYWDEHGIIRSRYTEDQWRDLLQKAGINDFSIKTVTEDLRGRNHTTKSGNLEQILTKIEFQKVEPNNF